jgi:L-2-hydroxycarboxylate dehydrogenase (NAD+)
VGIDVKGTIHTEDICTKGDLFIVIDPQMFTGSQDFLDREERLQEQIKSCKKAPSVARILLPGDPELMARAKRMKEGIPVDDTLWQQLLELGG